jgi:site-specific DNA-methyltransferase (adenine-specific)
VTAPEPYFADEHVQLYLGDMRELLPQLAVEADACVTDPPYGETSLAWDRWPDGWPALVAQHTNSMWCFGSMRMFLDQRDEFSGWKLAQDYVGEHVVDTTIWEKNATSGPNKGDRFSRVHEIATQWYRGAWRDIYHETPRVPSTAERVNPIGFVGNRKPNSVAHRGAYTEHTAFINDGLVYVRSVLRAKNIRRRACWTHPTEKPAEIIAPLIESSVPPGGLVLDPFAGSGSTLLTARQLGRRAIGIEASEEYCERAAKRLSEVDLFTGSAS